MNLEILNKALVLSELKNYSDKEAFYSNFSAYPNVKEGHYQAAKQVLFELNVVNATFYKEIEKNEIFLHSLS